MVLRRLRSMLNDYPAAWLALLSLAVIVLWPDVLAPFAELYIRFCATVFVDTSLFHHYPPYIVALLLLLVPVMIMGMLSVLIRHHIGQRRLEADIIARQTDIGARLTAVAHDAGLSHRLVPVDDPKVYAFCAGLVSPRVYASTGLLQTLSLDEVAAVFRHEAHHLRRRDPLRLMIADMIEALAAPFPAIRTLVTWARIRMELAADHAALDRVPVEVLASALLKVARARSGFTAQASVAGLSPTDARIAALLGKPIAVPFNRRDLIVSAAVLVTLAVVVGYLLTLSFPMSPLCGACPPYD